MSRLKSLFVKDFRSIDGEVNVSLDAPIVLIHGPNGAGKTSLLSAIELALTGSVPALSRAEPDYLAFLPHKDRPFGEVRLEIIDDEKPRSTDLKVTTNGISGSPILTGTDAVYFSERSYLAQSTLGRLLEIYQHTEKKSDSPLTRFVKELLGLDRMEALINGLHSAGNITRLKGPVPRYGEIRDEIPSTEHVISELRKQRTDISRRISAFEAQLRDQLEKTDPVLIDQMQDLTAIGRQLASDPDESALTELVRIKRELSVSQANWRGSRDGADASERTNIEAANVAARSALDVWIKQNGEQIDTLLARAAALFADISLSTESGYAERSRSLGARISTDIDRIQRVTSAHESALARQADLTRQIGEARTRLARLDEEIASAANTNETITRTLSEISTHIHDDVCPVCDRNFAEVSSTPLAAHVAAKIAAVVEQAGRLRSLVEGRRLNTSDVERLDRELATVTSQLIDDGELSRLKSRLADLTEVTRQLDSRTAIIEDGDRLRLATAQAARAVLALRNSDQSVVVLRSSLAELAHRVGLPVDREASIDSLLSRLASRIGEQEQILAGRQAARRAATETVKSLTAARVELSQLAETQSSRETALEGLRDKKAAADKMIDLGKDLMRQARDARGHMVRRVFNDELNAIWRDLFVRLAPEEPFIPAFAIPEASSADVEAVLETHHRRGGKGGNPRAMLSAGNLNTAALTLFLALHLSVKARLPWLVIDDPVQSMDEVHIAQFAALLRTLSKQMNRQVIIAVHERSLFDYLALELSPAFEGDRLNVIELGRNAIGQTISRWDPRTFVADRAIAA